MAAGKVVHYVASASRSITLSKDQMRPQYRCANARIYVGLPLLAGKMGALQTIASNQMEALGQIMQDIADRQAKALLEARKLEDKAFENSAKELGKSITASANTLSNALLAMVTGRLPAAPAPVGEY